MSDVQCVGTPNGLGGNFVWPAGDQLRPPCGWAGTSDQADAWADGAVLSCPHCGGKVKEQLTYQPTAQTRKQP